MLEKYSRPIKYSFTLFCSQRSGTKVFSLHSVPSIIAIKEIDDTRKNKNC